MCRLCCIPDRDYGIAIRGIGTATQYVYENKFYMNS